MLILFIIFACWRVPSLVSIILNGTHFSIGFPTPVSFIIISLLKFGSSNTILCTAGIVLQGRLSILFHIRVNNVPWSGLHRIECCFHFAFLFLSVKKKYGIFRCLVCRLRDCLPLSTSIMVLLLSWYIVVEEHI